MLDRQTNIDVFDKLVATEDVLMNSLFEILKSAQTRGEFVQDTSLFLLFCAECAGSWWAETPCRRSLGGLSVTACPAEDATERVQGQGTLNEPDDDPVTGNRFTGAAVGA